MHLKFANGDIEIAAYFRAHGGEAEPEKQGPETSLCSPTLPLHCLLGPFLGEGGGPPQSPPWSPRGGAQPRECLGSSPLPQLWQGISIPGAAQTEKVFAHRTHIQWWNFWLRKAPGEGRQRSAAGPLLLQSRPHHPERACLVWVSPAGTLSLVTSVLVVNTE